MYRDEIGYVWVCSHLFPSLRRLLLNWGLFSLINLHGVTRTWVGGLYKRGSRGAHDVGMRRYI